MATIKFNWKNLSNVEEKVRAEIDTHNSVRFDILKERKTITEDEAVRRSEKKFYKNPKLKDENGNSHTGWKNVLAILKGVDGSPLISETIVDIDFKLKDQAEPKDTDLLMDVRTVFSFSSAKVTLDPEISGTETLRYLEQVIYLQTIDTLWKEHLLAMDRLKEGIGLRGYGQRNPLQEYQKEGYEMFSELVSSIREETIQKLFRVQIARPEKVTRFERVQKKPLVMSHGAEEVAEKAQPVKRESKKVGRNDPCPCGSGKKYKKCHGR